MFALANKLMRFSRSNGGRMWLPRTCFRTKGSNSRNSKSNFSCSCLSRGVTGGGRWAACYGISLNANSGIICSRFQRQRLCNSWQPVWVNSICDFQRWRGKDQSCTPCLTPTTLPPDAPELCIWLIDQRCLSNRTPGGSPVPRLRLHRQRPDLNLEKLEERFAWKRRDSRAQPPRRVAHTALKKDITRWKKRKTLLISHFEQIYCEVPVRAGNEDFIEESRLLFNMDYLIAGTNDCIAWGGTCMWLQHRDAWGAMCLVLSLPFYFSDSVIAGTHTRNWFTLL